MLSDRAWDGVEGLGGGVGVEATIGGVLDWRLGAGEAGVFICDFKSTTSPAGFLITMAALFFWRTKVEEETIAGAAAGWAARCWGVPWAMTGAWLWPVLEAGRSDICDELRDMGAPPGWAGVNWGGYWLWKPWEFGGGPYICC